MTVSAENTVANKSKGKAGIDPITLEVICEGLVAVVKEMRMAIIRASYSSVIYEFEDFSCAVFTPEGEMAAQSWDHPGHVLPLPWGVVCSLDDFRGDLHPGDVILLNDPYRGGTHLNDVTLIVPVFDDAGNLMIFPAVRAHWVDVGGMVPGSYSGLSQNIYQEGVRIPPIKIIERGEVNRSAMALLMANMRVPEEREGDFHASLGACRIAENRIRRLYGRYGAETVQEAVRLHLDRTERRLRARIAELPDGDYEYEDYLEYFDGGALDPVLMRIKLTVAGDGIIADFAGSNPQVPGVVNSSLAVVGAGVFVAVKSTLDPGGAVNQGALRPIELRAPEGSIADVRDDAPAGAHGEVRKRAVSVALGALAQIIPERVSGDLCGTSFPNAIGGYNQRRGRGYVYYEGPAGGNGGLRTADGPSAYVNVDFGNLMSIQNVEAIENEMPLLVERCGLRTDSGGEGEHRGGTGMERVIRLLGEEASYSVLSDRAVIPSYGILGGSCAHTYRVSILREEPGGKNRSEIEFATPGKVTGHPLREGDAVLMQSGGGGGYGDPLRRDPGAVLEDVAKSVVSPERARDGYGVVFDDRGGVDSAATATRRGELEARRVRVVVVTDDTLDSYEGRRGRRRVLVLSPHTAGRLGLAEDGLLEMHGNNPAPLRAWARIQDGEAGLSGNGPATIRLDPFACRVLGVTADDWVELRALPVIPVPGGMAR